MRTIAMILEEVGDEIAKATACNGPMHSLHEGLSVIEEEVHELRLEVYKNPRKHLDRKALAREEAIQVAAMAVRLCYDVLNEAEVEVANTAAEKKYPCPQDGEVECCTRETYLTCCRVKGVEPLPV